MKKLNMQTGIREFTKKIIFRGMLTPLGVFLGFLFHTYAATALGPEQYGRVVQILGIGIVCSRAILLGIPTIAIRFSDQSISLKSIVRAIMVCYAASFFVIFLLSTILYILNAEFIYILITIFFVSVIDSMRLTGKRILLGQGRYWVATAGDEVLPFIFVIMAFILKTWNEVPDVIFYYISGSFIGALLVWGLIMRRYDTISKNNNDLNTAQLIGSSIRAVPYIISHQILHKFDGVIVAPIAGVNVAGVIGFATRLGRLASLPGNISSQSLIGDIQQSLSLSKKSIWELYIKHSILSIFPILVLFPILFLGRGFIERLLGEYGYESIFINIIILSLVQVFLGVSSLAVNILISSKREILLSKVNVISLFLLSVICFSFRDFGADIISIGILVVVMVRAIVLTYISLR